MMKKVDSNGWGDAWLRPVTLEGMVGPADLTDIITRTRHSKTVDASKLDAGTTKLETLHAMVTAMAGGQARRVQGLPVKDLRHMRNYTRKLRNLLDIDKHRAACDAIYAAILSGALGKRGRSMPRELFLCQDIADQLELLEASIDYLFAKRAEFQALPRKQRQEWLLRLDRPGEWHAKRELYPFLQGSENLEAGEKALKSEAHESPGYYLMRHIADLYQEIFGQRFSIVQRSGKADYDPRLGEARFSGPSVRFAVAIVEQLGLSSIFLHGSNVSGRTEEDRIINRAGDIWVQLKRNADEESVKSP
jgi:hypothetical protein